MNDWIDISITVDLADTEKASSIATMAVPYGIYIEDYANLFEDAWEVAHIDLIDEELLKKDKTKSIIHIYISPEESPLEYISFLQGRLGLENIDFEINQYSSKAQDWENNWKKYFHTMPVGEKLLIHPVWEELENPQNRFVLNIEPGLAFGSGTHETTRLCLEALEKSVSEGSSVLDVGCGSGILSLASLLLGARKVVGVDIDPLAVKTAKENGEKNGFFAPQYEIFEGDLVDCVKGKFDIIVANIVADIIIPFCKIAGDYMNKNAVFITSGIIDSRQDEVLAAFEENGFKLKATHSQKGWMCFECIKNL